MKVGCLLSMSDNGTLLYILLGLNTNFFECFIQNNLRVVAPWVYRLYFNA